MKLSQINNALDHQISGGSRYCWECYGPNARYLDYQTNDGHVSVVFDTETRDIYEATVETKNKDDADARPYRWLEPETKDALFGEAYRRGTNTDEAWDDVKWIDLETEEDFIEKAKAILAGEKFDTRVEVPVEFTNETFMELCREAHKRDITLNQMVMLVLEDAIATQRKQNEKTTTDSDSCGNDCHGCKCSTS
jgi:hypothetical protein